jgi:Outer membrane protein beta-barrel domain
MFHRLTTLLGVPLALGASQAEAQRFEVIPIAGYQFNAGFRSGATYTAVTPDTLSALGLAGGVDYGLIVGYVFSRAFQLELQYDRQETMLQIDESVDPGNIPELKLATNALQLGATLKAPIDILQPFFTVSVGANYLNPKDPGVDSETKFAWGIGIGVLRLITPHLGLRAQTRLLSTRLGKDDKAFCDITDECFGYTTTTHLNQANLLGAVIIAF